MTSPVFDGNDKTLEVIERFYYVNITTGEKVFLSTRTQGVKGNEYFNFFVTNRLHLEINHFEEIFDRASYG